MNFSEKFFCTFYYEIFLPLNHFNEILNRNMSKSLTISPENIPCIIFQKASEGL